jgi:hypothetical protein
MSGEPLSARFAGLATLSLHGGRARGLSSLCPPACRLSGGGDEAADRDPPDLVLVKAREPAGDLDRAFRPADVPTQLGDRVASGDSRLALADPGGGADLLHHVLVPQCLQAAAEGLKLREIARIRDRVERRFG